MDSNSGQCYLSPNREDLHYQTIEEDKVTFLRLLAGG